MLSDLATAAHGPHSSALEVGWRAFVDRSRDGGVTWQRSPYFDVADTHTLPSRKGRPASSPQQVGLIQPTIWASNHADVHVLCRSDGGALYRADSRDGGISWSPAVRTSLPNNNSGIDAVRLASGRVVLLHNPVGSNWGQRCPLRLSISEDNGHTFPRGVDLETELAPPFEKGEYSYPAVVAWPDQQGVTVTYTWHRVRIKCVLISEAEVLATAKATATEEAVESKL